ncbi:MULTISPECIES: ATP-binding protein [Actinoplanes]|uniref:ATP-binding protein n=1 Tax=Actinoplanes TaxID=1865 RepID=UPI0005F2E7CF|nr:MULTISPECIES: ATP-binding protein [Actinoplanes]GLY02751.1 hypothetical protein Acsp01_31300 [Actinoplanes sp. NBRC 101535]
MPIEVLRLPLRHGDPSAPVRHLVRDLLDPWCPPEALGDVLAVVSELVHNVTRHTPGGGELVLTVAAGDLLIEVTDGDTALPVARPPDPRRIGGRGLLLVAGLAREWGARPILDGKVVWARLPLPGVCGSGTAA